jgi:hypothetical protein
MAFQEQRRAVLTELQHGSRMSGRIPRVTAGNSVVVFAIDPSRWQNPNNSQHGRKCASHLRRSGCAAESVTK